jgi:endoglycosylceramidase
MTGGVLLTPCSRRRVATLALAALLLLAGTAQAQAPPSTLTARGGEVRDARDRVVMLHGVNFPWGLRVPEVAAQPAVPADEDAALVHSLGFNLARVQLSWKAIEPGRTGPNDPAICGPGAPHDPGQWDEAHAQAYLDRVEAVVHALHRHGVRTLFQIAQYGYSDRFGGAPSHPDWTICTDGLPITSGSGARVFLQPGVSAAASHFWNNDVRGDLQGEYDRMLHALATRFAHDRAVVGYELYNEPFHPEAASGDGKFDELVQCFYAGRGDPGLLADGARPRCPAGVPEEGAIQAVRTAAPGALIEPQAHIFTNFAVETRMGPLPSDNLVFNFHIYCLSEVASQPDRVREPECDDEEERAFDNADRTRHAMASSRQPEALPWFLSEFGFTANEETLRHMTELADRRNLGWAYFVWRADKGNPKGDTPGTLRAPDGSLRPFARILARPYPEALAGEPGTMRYDPDTRHLSLTYRPRTRTPTRIVLPSFTYGSSGACPVVSGASWRINRTRLLLVADRGARAIALDLRPGRCGSRSPHCAPSRRFVIRLRHPRGDRLRRARVTVNGRPARVGRRGRRLVARIVLRAADAGRTVSVRTIARARSGRLVRERRVYRYCVAA